MPGPSDEELNEALAALSSDPKRTRAVDKLVDESPSMAMGAGLVGLFIGMSGMRMRADVRQALKLVSQEILWKATSRVFEPAPVPALPAAKACKQASQGTRVTQVTQVTQTLPRRKSAK